MPAAEQLSAIAAACKQGGVSFDVTTNVVTNASCGRLAAALESARKSGDPVAVLQLLCHGGAAGSSFGLVLDREDAADESGVVDAARLRQLLAPYAKTLRLVVLCACDSGNPGVLGNQLGSVAQTLHRVGIPSVIASRFPLSVSGSIRLTEVLYHQLLAETQSLEASLLAVRRRLAEDPLGQPSAVRPRGRWRRHSAPFLSTVPGTPFVSARAPAVPLWTRCRDQRDRDRAVHPDPHGQATALDRGRRVWYWQVVTPARGRGSQAPS